MALVGTVKQQPGETQDYDIDFTEWLTNGDSLISATIVCLPTMPSPPTYAIGGKRVKVWIYAGGTTNTTYKITVSATSLTGRIKEAELRVKVKEI